MLDTTNEDELRRLVRAPGNMVDRAQREATAAHARARSLPWAATVRLDAEWAGFHHRTRAVMAAPAATPQAREEQAISALRIALDAKAHFDAYAVAHAAMRQEELQAAFAQDQRDGMNAAEQRRQAAAVAAGARTGRPSPSHRRSAASTGEESALASMRRRAPWSRARRSF